MVKLSDSIGTKGESATRIFGNERMGILFSKFQAVVIRSGFELEETIKNRIPFEIFTTLDALREVNQTTAETPNIQVVFKPSRPNPDNPSKSIQADFLIVDNLSRRFMLVEVKEGHVFDTKKADGELASLKNITSWLAQEYAYRTHYFICCFNQENKEEIVQGTKKRFSIDHVLTGREFCGTIGIDYDAIREERSADQVENRRFFLTELLAISEIRDEVLEILNTTDVTGEPPEELI